MKSIQFIVFPCIPYNFCKVSNNVLTLISGVSYLHLSLFFLLLMFFKEQTLGFTDSIVFYSLIFLHSKPYFLPSANFECTFNFSSFLRWKFVTDEIFLNLGIYSCKLSLSATFTVSLISRYVLFSFSLISKYFLISFVISSLNHWLYKRVLFKFPQVCEHGFCCRCVVCSVELHGLLGLVGLEWYSVPVSLLSC